jgi:hypothetical protein
MMNNAELMLPGDPNTIEVLVDNVSYCGIGVYIPKSIPEGTDVIIKIIYSQVKAEKVCEVMLGTVRWCHPMGTWFGVGVEFKYLNPKEHGLLCNVLEQSDLHGAE